MSWYSREAWVALLAVEMATAPSSVPKWQWRSLQNPSGHEGISELTAQNKEKKICWAKSSYQDPVVPSTACVESLRRATSRTSCLTNFMFNKMNLGLILWKIHELIIRPMTWRSTDFLFLQKGPCVCKNGWTQNKIQTTQIRFVAKVPLCLSKIIIYIFYQVLSRHWLIYHAFIDVSPPGC